MREEKEKQGFTGNLDWPNCDNLSMTSSPDVPAPGRRPFFGSTRLVIVMLLAATLTLCLVFLWVTRDAMATFSFLRTQQSAQGLVDGKKPVVDLSPWQTAQALAPLAVTSEEMQYAHEAERLADHDVDQAFASALRQAQLQQQQRVLTGDALALSQKVQQLQALVKDDQAQVQSLTAPAGSAAKPGVEASANTDDLDVAKAQLGLDSDELADAQHDLERASGDTSTPIQAELAAHEASMRQYDSQVQKTGQIAVLTERKHGTLAARLTAWFGQINRSQLLKQAQQQMQKSTAALIAVHNLQEAKANIHAADSPDQGKATQLSQIKARRAERQILSIYDDRIQTEQQLAGIYGKWAAQVELQHRIVLHLILQSLALILFIVLCMVIGDALVRRLMEHPALDRRQMHTLRSILELAIQIVGAVLILLVIFGPPQQTSTVLGLATAGLTIALQDFILAFLGWFVLMGKNGIRVGDWVEINGVGGEVTEIGLIYTTLLETGNLADKGYPTGRRIVFMNSFAIRGQYFNFSTAGQWMWDEITVNVPEAADMNAMVEKIHAVVLKETERDARGAEQEWKRGMRGDGLSRFSAEPVVNLRPSGSGVDILVHYVTHAPERFEMRNRLYQNMVRLLQEKAPEAGMV